MHGEPAHVYSDVLYSLSGWTQLPRLPEIEISVVMVTSYDGMLVPMTLLRKKGIKRVGGNPMLLDGYCAYGFSKTAGFGPLT